MLFAYASEATVKFRHPDTGELIHAHEILEIITFEVDETCSKEGKAGSYTECAGVLGFKKTTQAEEAVFDKKNQYFRIADKWFAGWPNKALTRGQTIQDGKGEFPPGTYVLKPRPPGQTLDRSRKAAVNPEPMTYHQAVDFIRENKISDIETLARHIGWDKEQAEDLQPFIDEMGKTKKRARSARVMGPASPLRMRLATE